MLVYCAAYSLQVCKVKVGVVWVMVGVCVGPVFVCERILHTELLNKVNKLNRLLRPSIWFA